MDKFVRLIRPSSISLFARCWPEDKAQMFTEASNEWLTSADPGEILILVNEIGMEVGITGWTPMVGHRAFLRWTAIKQEYRGYARGRYMVLDLLRRLKKEYGIRTVYETCDEQWQVDYFKSLGFVETPNEVQRLEVAACAGEFKHCLQFDLALLNV